MARTRAWFLAGAAVAAIAACARPLAAPPPRERQTPPAVEATSLLGQSLRAQPIDPNRRAQLEADLLAARARLDAQPDSEDAAIWYGRRLAYLGRFQDSISAFTDGLRHHPGSYRLLRHRGHRYITTRQLDAAIIDLTRAAAMTEGLADEVEPDGAPNRLNQPRSTTRSNIWYHLGLALYLQGDFVTAANAWRRCLDLSRVNDDMLVATTNWLYAALRRSGQDAEAAAILEPIRRDMDIIENTAYHRLLLLYKGELQAADLAGAGESPIDDATTAYGVGDWYWINGRPDEARQIWNRIVSGEQWAPFGFIAAEAELAHEGNR